MTTMIESVERAPGIEERAKRTLPTPSTGRGGVREYAPLYSSPSFFFTHCGS